MWHYSDRRKRGILVSFQWSSRWWIASCLGARGRDRLRREQKSSVANPAQKSATNSSPPRVNEIDGKTTGCAPAVAFGRSPSRYLLVSNWRDYRRSQRSEMG